MKYIDVEVKTAIIAHGVDSQNIPIHETVVEDNFMRKFVAVSRILSVSEQ